VKIILMGPPGAGKGTQAQRVSDKFNMTHLSSGDIFRGERASDSDLGEKLAQYMDAGKLVPDEIVVQVMAKAIREAPGEGLMLDGFPRTVPQAKALDEQLEKDSLAMDAVVVIVVPDDQIVERITGRRSCPKCGKVYHVKYMPPKQDGKCDLDGETLTQRSDDTEDVVRRRLSTYHAQTQPVIGYYKESEAVKVIEIDGSPSPDEVTETMVSSLKSLEN
jgi:adenylate kinase